MAGSGFALPTRGRADYAWNHICDTEQLEIALQASGGVGDQRDGDHPLHSDQQPEDVVVDATQVTAPQLDELGSSGSRTAMRRQVVGDLGSPLFVGDVAGKGRGQLGGRERNGGDGPGR